MSPNNKITDDKIREIKTLSVTNSIGGVAKKTGVCRKTVKKYIGGSRPLKIKGM